MLDTETCLDKSENRFFGFIVANFHLLETKSVLSAYEKQMNDIVGEIGAI